MRAATLVSRSLRHHWRTHLGVVLGVAVASAVLVGALAVGDSVRASLARQVTLRIGAVDAALVARERYFGADLADRVQQRMEGARVAPALVLPAVASVAGGGGRYHSSSPCQI